jgi:arylsulfatase A-like enzyme
VKKILISLALMGAALPALNPAASDHAAAQGVPERPNILVIVTDDQRGGLSVMPAVRHYFGKKGTTYKPGFVTTPACCPSRASIMTGRYAHNHKVKSNGARGATGAESLDHSTTMQAYLQDSGYRTGIVGKFLNPPWRLAHDPPFFDRWLTVARNQYYSGNYNDNGTIREILGYTTNVLRRNAMRFIRYSEEPWYLYLAVKAPHIPARPAPRYKDLRVPKWDGNPAVFEKNERDKPAYVRKEDHTLRSGNRSRRRQFRTLASVDDMVERLFEKLRDLGELNNTLAFFISDNGYMWSEHGLKGKSVPYRQAVTVPFLARWPGHLEAGDVDKRWAANIDIAPTVLEAAGVTPTTPQDGRSLLGDWRRDRILLEYWCSSPGLGCNRWRSTWSRSYQYTEYFKSGEVTFREYYKLRKDPWQLTNLLRDGRPGNDPRLLPLQTRLRADAMCAGPTCP